MKTVKTKLLFIYFVVGCLLAAMPAESPAQTTIEAGIDSWVGVEQTDLYLTLPADFFEPGSEPFEGQVALQGEPESVPWCAHCQVADILIWRPSPADFPDPFVPVPVPIEIIDLKLVSVRPIYVGDIDSFFDVYMSLTPEVSPPPGSNMNITMSEGGGGGGGGSASGTIDSVNLNIEARIVLVSVDNPADTYFHDVSLTAIHIGLPIPWKQEAEKETWPSYYNNFYAYGDEPLVLSLLYNCCGLEGLEAGQLVLAAPQRERGYFSVSTFDEWSEVNEPAPTAGSHIRPMDPCEWEDYMQHWNDNLEEGDSYPENEFIPSDLYVYEGNEAGWEPNDAGLVMAWGDPVVLPTGSWSSAWKWVYGADPDLRRSIIKVTVTPPSLCNISTVSFGIIDGAKRRCTWQWNVPGTIPYDKPTTVIIDPAIPGVAATSPKADGYACNNNFNLANSLSFEVDENSQWVFNPIGVPAPGKLTFVGPWNYWHNLIVLPKPPASKFYVKWSQRPEPIDPNHPEDFNGWDEISSIEDPCQILADDWLCMDDRPVTDIHWWGSYEGWTQPEPPPVVPQAFHIGIWTDDPCDFPGDISHPNIMIWENICENWVWNFAGFDVFPGQDPNDWPRESCFQFNQLLSEDEWFWQDPNAPWDTDGDPCSAVYWVSIYPIYNPWEFPPPHRWGWKTRPHYYNDDAYRIHDVIMPPVDWPWPAPMPPNWPPRPGAMVTAGEEVVGPFGESWDLAFELSTNEPGEFDLTADLNGDGVVDFLDFAIFANQWLQTEPSP
ncbi:MAG: DUF7901 domain-containing protein [Planctomycetota bacterium]|jgi:hypothetical protein